MDNLTKHMTVTADIFMKQTDEHIKKSSYYYRQDIKSKSIPGWQNQ